jgi:hypothetical protein
MNPQAFYQVGCALVSHGRTGVCNRWRRRYLYQVSVC